MVLVSHALLLLLAKPFANRVKRSTAPFPIPWLCENGSKSSLTVLKHLPVILVSLRKPEYNIGQQDAPSSDELEVRTLYRELLDGWNQRNAEAFAAPFEENGEVIGFDGSQMTGRVDIAATL